MRGDRDQIALYGSLMRGLGALADLGIEERMRFVGPCRIAGRLFDLGAYPGLCEGPGAVRGELYTMLDEEVLSILDGFEDFRPEDPEASLYVRKHVALLDPPSAHAWLYFYNRPSHATRRVDSGDWRAHLARRSDG